MNFIRAKHRYPNITGGTAEEDIVINLEHVQTVGYRAARVVPRGDNDNIDLEATLKFQFAGAEKVTLYAEEADRVWKLIEGLIE